MALWYERGLGVRFWDYSGQRGNLWGRVCLPFSTVWGALVLCLVYWIHPVVAAFVRTLPAPLIRLWELITLTDLLLSGAMLRQTHDRACLRWYDRFISNQV